MAILQQFEYTWPDGTTPITFTNWIATLTQAEKDEFAPALARQDAIRQQWIDNGLLELVDRVGYRWKDQDTFNIGKPVDPTWLTYWNRWQEETGVIFSYNVVQS